MPRQRDAGDGGLLREELADVVDRHMAVDRHDAAAFESRGIPALLPIPARSSVGLTSTSALFMAGFRLRRWCRYDGAVLAPTIFWQLPAGT